MYSTHPYPIYPVTSPKTYLAALNANLLYMCIYDLEAYVYIHMYIYIHICIIWYIFFNFFPYPKGHTSRFKLSLFTSVCHRVSPGHRTLSSLRCVVLLLRNVTKVSAVNSVTTSQPCKIPRNWEWQGHLRKFCHETATLMSIHDMSCLKWLPHSLGNICQLFPIHAT